MTASTACILWIGTLFSASALDADAESTARADRLNAETQLRRIEATVEAQRARVETLRRQITAVQERAEQALRQDDVRRVVRELMADATFAQGLYPDAAEIGYDRGFYIRSADDQFSFKTTGLVRIRYVGIERQNDNPRQAGLQRQDDESGFTVNDLVLTFHGYLHSPRLTYQIVMEGPSRKVNMWRTFTAHINYEVAPELQVVAGLMKVPFGRQELVGKADQQFVDRPLANEALKAERSIGAAVHGTLSKRLSYVMSVLNGFRDPDDSPSLDQTDTNFAYAGRLIAHLMGSPIKTESDLAWSKDPQWEIAVSGLYSDDNGDRSPISFYHIPDSIRSGRGLGGFAMVDLSGTDVAMFGADTAFRYRGLSITAEYFLRGIDGDSEWSPWERRTGDHGTSHQQGGYVQGGYFVVPKRVELAARLGGVWDIGSEGTWEYTIGANYYPWGTHNVVVQTDLTRIDEAPLASSNSNWSQNDQVNMIRVQLQAKF